MAGGGQSHLKKTKNASPLVNPFQDTLDMPDKDEQYSFEFPKETKFFEVRLRKHAILKFSYTEDEVLDGGTDYGTSGNYFSMDGMELANALTVYFRSSQDSDTLEIHYWT